MASKFLLRFLKVENYMKKVIKDDGATKKRTVWQGITHGFHVVERGDLISEGLVLAQREQVEGFELWLFGAFDKNIAYPLTKYLQSNIFEEKLNEHQIERKAKDTMKKSYLITREKMHEVEKADEVGGFTTALVMNGKKFVAAHFGGYKVVVCRDGVATQIGKMHEKETKGQHWSLLDMLHIKCLTGKQKKSQKSSKLIVTTQKVESEIEFIILASPGIWEVMNNQEAVDLISHIEDTQRAAESLAEEAIIRMSKSAISCIVIRFR